MRGLHYVPQNMIAIIIDPGKAPDVIGLGSGQLPAGIPAQLADAIFEGQRCVPEKNGKGRCGLFWAGVF